MSWKNRCYACFGQDSEFFIWDKEKDSVVPSYLYFPPKEANLLLIDQKTADYYQGPDFSERQKQCYLKDFEGYVKVNPRPDVQRGYTRSGLGSQYLSSRVFRDGLAVEFNTAPNTCRGLFFNDLRHMVWLAEGLLPENLSFTSRPWVEITQEMMKDFPEDLLILGCSPTLDAYTGRRVKIEEDPRKLLFRTSGSHLHMSFHQTQKDQPGYLPLEPEDFAPFIKAADLLLGVPFTYVFGDELEFKRRKLYGKAGEFRHQHYPAGYEGLEYRVLSSRLWNHTGPFSLFYGIWKFIFGYGEFLDQVIQKWDKAWEPTIQEAINLGSPKALEEALALSVKAMPDPAYYYSEPALKRNQDAASELIGVRGSGISESDKLSVWAFLRELSKSGAFEDAGLRNPRFTDGHNGWQYFMDRGGQAVKQKIFRPPQMRTTLAA